MDKEPLVSVIVLTYQQELTIKRTLDSILHQETDYSVEIIIGEDASSDMTRIYCEEYKRKYPDIITLLPPAANKGVIANYRDCLALCHGKYIACCAGDDWWHNPHKIALQVDFLEDNVDFGVVYTDCSTFYSDTSKMVQSIYNTKGFPDPLNGELYNKAIWMCPIVAPTVMFKRCIYEKYIDLDSFLTNGFLMEDFPMWLELLQHTKFKYLPISTVTYSIADGSLCHQGRDISKQEKFDYSTLLVQKYFICKYPIAGISESDFEQLFYRKIFFSALVYGNVELVNKYIHLFTAISWKDKIKKNIGRYKILLYCYSLFYQFKMKI